MIELAAHIQLIQPRVRDQILLGQRLAIHLYPYLTQLVMTGDGDDNNILPPLVNVKPEIKTEPVRDPDVGPNPLPTRLISDRGAKGRYSDIIILN